MAVPLSNKLRNTLQPVALDKAPAEPGMPVDPWLGGTPQTYKTPKLIVSSFKPDFVLLAQGGILNLPYEMWEQFPS